ncbi:hypothetical protein [Bordetella petrii]|uniref:hypothetical protein n=1 Tax=Bordetella petrii TaxID=94624 RepID=UPI001A97D2A9|nr:hypothetical protein [Bordetella petrii]MBO1110676.1 hypothetical protein [Bordetella petrii]
MNYRELSERIQSARRVDAAITAMQQAIREPAAPGTAMGRTFLYGLQYHYRNGTLLHAPDLAAIYELLDHDIQGRLHAVLAREIYVPSYGL